MYFTSSFAAGVLLLVFVSLAAGVSQDIYAFNTECVVGVLLAAGVSQGPRHICISYRVCGFDELVLCVWVVVGDSFEQS